MRYCSVHHQTRKSALTPCVRPQAKNVVAMSMTTAEIKKSLKAAEYERAVRGICTPAEAIVEDKMDELRVALPSASTMALRKLLQEADGDVEKVIAREKAATGGGLREML